MNAQHKPFAAQLAQSQAASDTLQAIAALVPEGSRVLDLAGDQLCRAGHGADEDIQFDHCLALQRGKHPMPRASAAF